MNIIIKCRIFIFIFAMTCSKVLSNIQPVQLRTEYKVNPFIDELKPRLSWELNGKGFNKLQSAYQILVSSNLEMLKENNGDLWNTNKVKSLETNQIIYDGVKLTSKKKVYWKVRVWDEKGNVGEWSEISTWEMGLLSSEDWQASWIGFDTNPLINKKSIYHLPPSPYFRKIKSVNKKVLSARLYISSLGLHEFYINGEKIGNDYFASGWTDYNKRIYYNVYDITPNIHKGDNVFGATLAPGWYAGYLGYALLVGTKQTNQFYGKFPLLKAQIELIYGDGTRELIKTDQFWKANIGAIQEADFLQGEMYDSNKELIGWEKSNYDDKDWKFVETFNNQLKGELQLYPSNPVRVVKVLEPKHIRKNDKGNYIVDFGQNFAGNVKIKIRGNKGDTITLRYGEMCYPDGKLMTENMRMARSTDYYIIKGDKNWEEWSPKFTFHGFQFVEVVGAKEIPKINFIKGLVLSSDLSKAGNFKTDNTMLNKLYSNIVWTQRSNYMDIPTDCPQRDERLGWTGDAQIYIRSASFNVDIAPFYKKWIKDLHDSQWPNGAYPVYSPMPKDVYGKAAIRASDTFSPGWSEAGIICTYEIFKAYNDTRIIEESLPYMNKFMEFLDSRMKDGVFKEGTFEDISPKGGFADWLSVGKKTSPDLLASIYYFYCSKLMSEMTGAIGNKILKEHYDKKAEIIKIGFKSHYTDGSGKFLTDEKKYGDGNGYIDGQLGFSGHTQTAYANAIYSGILDNNDMSLAGLHLKKLIEENNYKLTTGFLGFKPLLPALSKTGSYDEAYALILSTEYPSLGYEVVNGATSIWERWDSYITGEGFKHNAGMNSFSHYAFGAVNEWFFENIGGIKNAGKGFRKIIINPEILSSKLNFVECSYHAITGEITSNWLKKNNNITQNLTIPVNVLAVCKIPINVKNIKINDIPIYKSKNVRNISKDKEYFKFDIGSGNYKITYQN